MRKFLLTLAVLCGTVSGWAQVLGTSIDVNKAYTLQCKGDHVAFLAEKENAFTGTSSNATNFVFEKGTEDNQYYVKSLVSNKYLSYVNNSFSPTDEKTTLWSIGTYQHTANVISLAIVGQTDQYLNNAGGTNGLQLKGHDGGPAAGNRCSLWELREATPEIESGKIYRIINKANAGKAIKEDADFLLSVKTVSENDKSQMWYVEGNNISGYTFKNVKTADYANFVDQIYTHWGTKSTPVPFYITKVVSATGSTPNYYAIALRNNAKNNEGACMHYSGERVVRWTAEADASQWQFEEVTGIDVNTIGDEGYNSFYTEFSSKKLEAQNLLTASAFTENSVELTTENTTCPAAISDNSDGGGVPALLDENNETFMHTKYSGKGSVGEPHYIQVDLGEGKTSKFITFSYRTRHNNQNNNPETIIVKGSVDGNSYEDVQTLTNLPDGLVDYTSNVIGNGKAYRYFRFVVTETTNNAKHEGYVFFSLAKFRMSVVSVNDNYASKAIVLKKMNDFLNSNEFSESKPENYCVLNTKEILPQLNDLIYGSTIREYPFTLTTDKNAPICYQIISGRSSNNETYFYTLKPKNGGKVLLETNSQDNIFSYWFFMEDPENGKLMVIPFIDETNPLGYLAVSDGADKLTNIHTTAGFAGYYYELINYGGVEGYPYALKPYGASTNVSNHGGTSNHMGFYGGSSDGGTAMKFSAVQTPPALEYRQLLLAITTATNKCPGDDRIGTMLNGYSTESVNDYKNTITSAESLYGTVSTTSVETLNATINSLNNLYSVLNINLPENGKFYRLRCSGDGMKYLQSTLDGDRLQVLSKETSVNATFCFVNSALLSYTTGKYINAYNFNNVGTKSDVVFTKDAHGNLGTYNIKVNGRWIYGDKDNGNKIDSGSGDSAGNDDGYRWWLEEVATLPFTFKEAALGYATFNAPVAVQLPDDVKAYTSEIQEGNKLKMTELTGGIVPANTAVLLWNESVADADVTVNLTITENVTFEGTNKFVGTVASENLNTEKDCYSLQKGTKGKVGFYAKSTGTKGGFKAWIEMPKSSEARAFVIIFDGEDATGIKEALGLENENVEIYDLSGRRLDKPAKGVNVIGGKTVIVR